MGERIRAARERAGLTQKELAAAIGVNHSAISFWENGQTVPTINNLVKIAGILGVSPGDLITG